MTKQDIAQLEQAFGEVASRCKVEKVPGVTASVKLVSEFVDRNGVPFSLYAYRHAKGGKLIYLTDAGQILRTLQRSGMGVEMGLLQRVMRSYGLKTLDDGSILDDSKRALGERIGSLFQAWAAVDGILRTWTLPKET